MQLKLTFKGGSSIKISTNCLSLSSPVMMTCCLVEMRSIFLPLHKVLYSLGESLWAGSFLFVLLKHSQTHQRRVHTFTFILCNFIVYFMTAKNSTLPYCATKEAYCTNERNSRKIRYITKKLIEKPSVWKCHNYLMTLICSHRCYCEMK